MSRESNRPNVRGLPHPADVQCHLENFQNHLLDDGNLFMEKASVVDCFQVAGMDENEVVEVTSRVELHLKLKSDRMKNLQKEVTDMMSVS